MLSNRLCAAYVLPLLSYLLPVIAEDEDVGIRDAAIVPPGFSPRYYMDASPAHRLPRRQGDGQSCGEGDHTCLELGDPGVNKCCPVDLYCYLKDDWEVGCCGFGSTCNSRCPSSYVLFNNTVTSITEVTATATASGSTGVVSVFESTITSISVACKPRQCSIGAYQCAAQFGGNCCDNSQSCISNGCAVAVTTKSALVSTYNGCGTNTNMFQCSATDGVAITGTGNCCSVGQTCTTDATGGPACTGTPTPPGGFNITTVDTSLSQGAKAGIGAGVAVGAALVIAAATWFCLRRRREARRTSEAAYRSRQTQQTPTSNPAGAAADMSEVSGPASRSSPHQTGLVYEYFGPDAVRGPYTQDEDETHESTAMLEHGVPVQPRNPSDIAVPVEIDSRLRHSEAGDRAVAAVGSGQVTPGTATNATTPAAREEEQGPFELYGSLTPSPLSPEEGTGTEISRNMDYLTVHSSEERGSSPGL